MTDDDDKPETPPKPTRQGRSLRDRPPERDTAADDFGDDRRRTGAIGPDPEPEPRGDDIVDRRHAAAHSPKVLVWNTSEGNRPAPCREAAVDEHGNTMRDGAGNTVWAVNMLVILQPGLNLVPSESWLKIRAGLELRISSGEVQGLGDDPRAVQSQRLVRAIMTTGLDEPLRWIAERDQRGAVLDAVEKQRMVNASVQGRTG